MKIQYRTSHSEKQTFNTFQILWSLQNHAWQYNLPLKEDNLPSVYITAKNSWFQIEGRN